MLDFYATIYMFRNLVYDEVLTETANLTNFYKRKVVAFRGLNFTKFALEVILPDAENVLKDLERQVSYFFAANDMNEALAAASALNRKILSQT